MGKMTKAEAMEAFDKGPTEDTRIAFTKEMENVRNGVPKEVNEQVEISEADEPEDSGLDVGDDKADTRSSDDAAGQKTPEPKKEDKDDATGKKTESKENEVIDPVMVRLELLERESKLKDLKMQSMQTKLENRELLARQRASDLGNLKRGTRQADPEDDRRTSLIEDVRSEGSNQPDPWRQEINQERSANALQKTILEFAGENEDADEYAEQMSAYVDIHRADYFEELSSGNPKLIARATKLLLGEALVAAKEFKYGEELESLKTTRQKQLEDLKEKKQGASASGGSASEASSSGNSAKAKSLKDLSDDDLRELIRQNRANAR